VTARHPHPETPVFDRIRQLRELLAALKQLASAVTPAAQKEIAAALQALLARDYARALHHISLALAAALANAPDMDDLPPPDDTVLEAPDMPLEIPDEGALAAELAEPEPQEGDNPLQDEMSEPSPLLTGEMANIDPDLAFDFDAVFQDAAPAAPKLDRSALAAALASAPHLEELHQEDAVTADSGEAVTPEQVDTKLDLARVYIDMGDEEGAREILVEVMAEGTDEQRNTALKLMEKL